MPVSTGQVPLAGQPQPGRRCAVTIIDLQLMEIIDTTSSSVERPSRHVTTTWLIDLFPLSGVRTNQVPCVCPRCHTPRTRGFSRDQPARILRLQRLETGPHSPLLHYKT